MPECPKCNSLDIEVEKQQKVYLRYICKKCGCLFTLEAVALAKRILRIRTILGITQAELANHLGVSSNIISQWELSKISSLSRFSMIQIKNMEREIAETGTVKIHKGKNRQGPKSLSQGEVTAINK